MMHSFIGANAPSPVKRPRIVEVAVSVLLVALVVGLAESADEILSIPDQGIVLGLLISVVAFFLFNLYKIWAGRNWARVLYTVLFALGCFGSVSQLSETLQESISRGIADALLLAVQITALAMLYLPKSNAWFSRNDV